MRSLMLACSAVLLLVVACTGRDRRPVVDSGPLGVDSGPGTDASVDSGPTDAGGVDAGPAVGSCLGACSAAGAAECPSFDSETCRTDCTTDQSSADAAGCGSEYRLLLGCRQMAFYTCDGSGEPATADCEAEATVWLSCMGAG
jgi:hypothetical protein